MAQVGHVSGPRIPQAAEQEPSRGDRDEQSPADHAQANVGRPQARRRPVCLHHRLGGADVCVRRSRPRGLGGGAHVRQPGNRPRSVRVPLVRRHRRRREPLCDGLRQRQPAEVQSQRRVPRLSRHRGIGPRTARRVGRHRHRPLGQHLGGRCPQLPGAEARPNRRVPARDRQRGHRSRAVQWSGGGHRRRRRRQRLCRRPLRPTHREVRQQRQLPAGVRQPRIGAGTVRLALRYRHRRGRRPLHPRRAEQPGAEVHPRRLVPLDVRHGGQRARPVRLPAAGRGG